MEEDMQSRFLVMTGSLAALSLAASLQLASPVHADSNTLKGGNTVSQHYRTNTETLRALQQIPLQCSVGSGGDVAATVRVYNQTSAMIPAGKTVTWILAKDASGTQQKGATVLTQNLAPQQAVFVGSTLNLHKPACTASVAL
jgi:hypothetical protein